MRLIRFSSGCCLPPSVWTGKRPALYPARGLSYTSPSGICLPAASSIRRSHHLANRGLRVLLPPAFISTTQVDVDALRRELRCTSFGYVPGIVPGRCFGGEAGYIDAPGPEHPVISLPRGVATQMDSRPKARGLTLVGPHYLPRVIPLGGGAIESTRLSPRCHHCTVGGRFFPLRTVTIRV